VTGAPAEALSAGLLVAALAFAVVRPKGWPEAIAAVPAAVVVVAAGTVSPHDASAELRRLLAVVGFLAAILLVWPEAAADVTSLPPPPPHKMH